MTLLTGLLPLSGAVDVTERVAPMLLSLLAVTVLAELADAAQVFNVAAVRAARLGRGRTPALSALSALVIVLGTVTTIVLSLDTTAVLFTPVVPALAARLRLSPLPFAMAAVRLANTASLLLPVSNLTNLLAVGRLWLPVRRRAGAPAGGSRAVRGAALACPLLVPALLAGAPMAYAASGSALLVVAVCLWRRRSALR